MRTSSPALGMAALAALLAVPVFAAPIVSPQSLAQMSHTAPRALTPMERNAAIKRLTGSDTPPPMGTTTTLTPALPYKDGVAMGYFNATGVVTNASGGMAALSGGSATSIGAVTLDAPVAAGKAYLIDCALGQYAQAAWTLRLNGYDLKSDTGVILSDHLSVLTPPMPKPGTLNFTAGPPPGKGSQLMMLSSCSITAVG